LRQQNRPFSRSSKQQRRWQQQESQHEFSQPQLCSQQQLCSQAQLCSQQQLGSQQPPPPPSRPKKAFALPAEPSTRATTSVAEAKHRFIGETPKYGEGKLGASSRAPEGVRDRRWKGALPRPPTSDL
jgi:hypothetical protein